MTKKQGYKMQKKVFFSRFLTKSWSILSLCEIGTFLFIAFYNSVSNLLMWHILIPFSEIVGEIMLNIVRKFFLKLRIHSQHFDKAWDINALEVTVCKSSDIATRFNNLITPCRHLLCYVAPHQVTFPCKY